MRRKRTWLTVKHVAGLLTAAALLREVELLLADVHPHAVNLLVGLVRRLSELL
jgi:hypothetical protein